MIGVGASRIEDRVFAALGIRKAEIFFEQCESVEFGGVLLFLHFLIANVLMSYNNNYSKILSVYYYF